MRNFLLFAAMLATITGSPAAGAAERKLPISKAAAGKLSIEELEAVYLRARCGEACEEELMLNNPDSGLSLAQRLVLQDYTTSNYVDNERIMDAGLRRVEPSALKVFRGTSLRHYGVQKKGNVITLDRFVSTSSDREKATDFIRDALFTIHARKARSLQGFSSVWEHEYILLPGTKLRVEKIAKKKVDLGMPGEPDLREVTLVELTEVD